MKQHLNIQKFWGETENTVSDQHLVPVWKVTEPLKEIERLCLGARHREVPAVHEDIRLRKVPQEAVYPVGIGQMQNFQFHSAKLIISRDPDEHFRKCHHCTRLVSLDKGNSFYCKNMAVPDYF